MNEAQVVVLNPTGKQKVAVLPLAPRPADLQGKTVGLVELGDWWMTSTFLQRYEELLKERCGVGEVVYVNEIKEGLHLKSKAGVLPDDTIKGLAGKCDAVFVGVGN